MIDDRRIDDRRIDDRQIENRMLLLLSDETENLKKTIAD